MIKRSFLKLMTAATVALGMAATAIPALAADVTMNVGFGAPEKSLYGRFGVLFQKHVAEKSGGNIEVKLRCCNQISSEDEAFKAMDLGNGSDNGTENVSCPNKSGKILGPE